MPTYEYECESCGFQFELRQAMTETPVRECPECRGSLKRVLTGGAGFFVKEFAGDPTVHQAGECSLEKTGRTCCGLDERCSKPFCEF